MKPVGKFYSFQHLLLTVVARQHSPYLGIDQGWPASGVFYFHVNSSLSESQLTLTCAPSAHISLEIQWHNFSRWLIRLIINFSPCSECGMLCKLTDSKPQKSWLSSGYVFIWSLWDSDAQLTYITVYKLNRVLELDVSVTFFSWSHIWDQLKMVFVLLVQACRGLNPANQGLGMGEAVQCQTWFFHSTQQSVWNPFLLAISERENIQLTSTLQNKIK